MSRKKKESLALKADNLAQKVLNRVTGIIPRPDAQPPEPPSSLTLQGKSLNCFLCGRPVEVKLSKKGRPYFHCLDCYLQCFTRGDAGIKRLARLIQGDHE